MLVVLSPAKSLDFESPLPRTKTTLPRHAEDTASLLDVVARLSPEQVGRLMDLSEALAELNWERFQEWDADPEPLGARPAILAFRGDTYAGVDVSRYTTRDFTAAQKRIRILSGLHGVLRPLDLIQPYRLEMGTKLETARGHDLYTFWGNRISQTLAHDLDAVRPRVLVNLASQEYFRAVQPDALDATVVTPRFEELRNGEYKIISFSAKRARGAMASWIVLNRVASRRRLRDFSELGYRFEPARSTPQQPTFTRPGP